MILKKYLTTLCFIFVQRSLIFSCNAVEYGASNFIDKYILYNTTEQKFNKIKIPGHTDGNKKEDQSGLNGSVVPLKSYIFSTFSEKDVYDVVKYLKLDGTSKFISMVNIIFKNLNVNGKAIIFSAIQKTTQDYICEVDTCVDTMFNQKITCPIEEELYILDLIEAVSKIFANKCKSLMNVMKRQVNNSFQENFNKTLLRKIKNSIIKGKTQYFNYICEKMHICRHFPSFSDHVAVLLKQILSLPDDKLLNIIKTFNKSIESKVLFLENTIGSDALHFISKSLISVNIANVRNFISIVKDILTNRFNILKSKNEGITRSSKSVRILIDMVDTAYEKYLQFQYYDLQSLTESRLEAKGANNDNLKTDIIYYINIFEAFVSLYWPSEVKNEAKVLIKVMTTENATVDEKYMYLFNEGSSIRKDSLLTLPADHVMKLEKLFFV